MKLSELLNSLPDCEVVSFSDRDVQGISYDTRTLSPGEMFVAIQGTSQDGHLFIEEAIKKGCSAVVVGRRVNHMSGGLPQIVVRDTRQAIANLSNHFHDYPSHRMCVVGITGTNGKTTTAHFLKAIIESAHNECAMLGTVRYQIGKREIPSWLTTPDVTQINGFLAEAYSIGIRHAVMEISSHSLAQGRVRGIDFEAAVFTNITRDHLDFHGTVERYHDAKMILFRGLGADRWAVLNADDPNFTAFREATCAKVVTYGVTSRDADIRCNIRNLSIQKTDITLAIPEGDVDVSLALPCAHNVANAAASAAAASALGIAPGDVKRGLESVTSVPGRLERVDCGQDFDVLVDFAHTEDALRSVISGLRGLIKGRLIVVFGCGGDRDKLKRPKMGAVVEKLADRAILTSDNPRSEDPGAIIRDVLSGIRDVSKFVIEPDRRAAVNQAIMMARAGDTLLIAGKGHEAYQIVGKTVAPFDDREVARDALRNPKSAIRNPQSEIRNPKSS